MLPYSELSRLCRSFALLLHGGIPLSEGAGLLSREEREPNAALLAALGSKLEAGCPLWEAMEETGDFPAQATAMVRIGEASGRLEQALDALADYYEERCRSIRKMKQAIAYPALILILVLMVFAVLLTKVLPVFDGVYASLGSGLTGLAGGLLRLGQGISSALPGMIVMLVVLAGIVLVCRVWPDFGKKGIKALENRIGDRGVFRKFHNARFARGLSMGLSSGLSLEQAMTLAEGLLADVPSAATRCRRCREALEQGEDLGKALAEANLLTPAQGRMLAIGCRSGSADRVMEDLAEKKAEEAETALDTAISRIEPAMVLAASLLVGLVLLSIMLPLLEIMSTIGGGL